MTLRDWVLIVSVCVNFVSVAVTVWTWRRSQEAARLQAQMERFFLFEGKLAEWPDALTFYDIDREAARRDGVTSEQIAYVVLAINALMADYRSRPGRVRSLGRVRNLKEFIEASSYWSHLLRQPRTALVWRYARNCVSEPWREQITRFVDAHSSATGYPAALVAEETPYTKITRLP
jgi:hypothetical protein